MIKCPECGKDLSDQAQSCPNCGRQLKSQSRLAVIILLLIAALLTLFMAMKYDQDRTPVVIKGTIKPIRN